jgi:hypothetical protein
VVPLPSPDDDAVDVRRYVATLLLAQSAKPWPWRTGTRRAVDQADSWLSPLHPPTSAEHRLARRRVGSLTPLERRLITLSAAAVQHPRLIVVEEPDRDLDPGAMSWFAGVCAELVHDTETTVLLIGSRVTALADQPVAAPVAGPRPEPVGGVAVPTSPDDRDLTATGGAPAPDQPDPAIEERPASVDSAPPNGPPGSGSDGPPDATDDVAEAETDGTEPREQNHELTEQ